LKGILLYNYLKAAFVRFSASSTKKEDCDFTEKTKNKKRIVVVRNFMLIRVIYF
jgi:hypothetical protein